MAQTILTFQERLDMESPLHHGLGFSDFVARLNLKVSIRQIADDFGVSRKTIYEWIDKYQKELGGYNAEREKTNS